MLNRNKMALAILSLIILVLLALQTPLLLSIRTIVWQGWAKSIARIAKIGPLNVENDVLTQLEHLQIENARLRSQQYDYDQLRKQLGSHTYESLRPISALASLSPTDNFRTTLAINRGSADGVVLNAPVVINDAVLIGIISEIREHTSTSELLLGNNRGISAQVVDQENAEGLVQSRSFTSLVLTTIPRDASIETGQSIATLPTDTMPAGLFIGSIADIDYEENQAYQEAKISIPYDISKIRTVTILSPP
jgi:cell shape-determining protein MreC